MGFPTSNILTNDNLIEEFVCPICSDMVEYPIVTSCSHLFCKNCLEEWLAVQREKRICPKCNANLQVLTT